MTIYLLKEYKGKSEYTFGTMKSFNFYWNPQSLTDRAFSDCHNSL